MELNKKTDTSLLYDFYSPMLTDRQKELMEYYYGDDLSLSEISDLAGITRQGVRDAIKKSETILDRCERKLGLCEKFKEQNKDLGYIINRLSQIDTDDDVSDIVERAKKLLI